MSLYRKKNWQQATAALSFRRELPPEVPPPRIDQRIEVRSPGNDLWLGSASHVGPPAISSEKGNEDYAFHALLRHRDDDWLVLGVADGVGQSVWAERASRHASHALLEVVSEGLATGLIPRAWNELNPPNATEEPSWYWSFSEKFCEQVANRLGSDVRLLSSSSEPYLPCWRGPSGELSERFQVGLYEKLFFTASTSTKEIANRWMQTTILTVVLGPEGGFGLFLGDGCVRIDRFYQTKGKISCSRALLPLESTETRSPDLRVSLCLQPEEVVAGMRKIPVKNANSIGAFLATDGVSKTPADGFNQALRRVKKNLHHGKKVRLSGSSIEDVQLGDSATCERLLESLAAGEPGLVELDNMSLGYASRPVREGRA